MALPTPLCTTRTRRSLSPCPNLNLIHYIIDDWGYDCDVIKAACMKTVKVQAALY
ncbi:cation-transporting ATPase [Kingella kingae]|uniref:Cation-transporting ATPase n=1 Tax=Kingella kingae ATCC 23330 TaxID=887327 RepID=F5S8Q6_KINKI|nr:hypothetical protein [Kingella kingae]EGK07882.1 cation-transporting ATPase [Kingella kingae ATCC 23330]MDK4563921.1 cation-transporting ATPase [Kingella kingae]